MPEKNRIRRLNRLLRVLHYGSFGKSVYRAFLRVFPVLANRMIVAENKRISRMFLSGSPKVRRELLEKWYYRRTGNTLDLDQLKTYNEKIQWMKLYDTTELKTQLSDKYMVRQWVEQQIGAEYLIPIYGVWERFDDIDFQTLPDRFVLKCNHGSSWNVFVGDKSRIDRAKLKRTFDHWMALDFAFVNGFEMQYSAIPRRIIAEAYLLFGKDLPDYKMICFGGTPKYIWMDSERFTAHKRTIFDFDWNQMQLSISDFPPASPAPPKPDQLEKMYSLSQKLSEHFAFVRVDFYEVNGRVYFGEMTFTPVSGITPIRPSQYDLILGELICLPVAGEKSPEIQ